LFGDAAVEEKTWFTKHQVLPINHMVVVSATLAKSHPEVVREVHRLLVQSATMSAASPRFTSAEMCRSLDLITRYSTLQRLIPREFTVDELFDDVTRALI